MNDDDYYSGSDGDGNDGDGDGEDGDKGAWRKMGDGKTNSKSSGGASGNAAAAATSAAAAAAASGATTATDSDSSKKLYVSPALRSQSLLQPIRMKKDALPDINNQEYFPTLGDAKKEELRKKKNEPAFEEVRSGARFQRSSDLPTNAPVSIGNRYNSLADS